MARLVLKKSNSTVDSTSNNHGVSDTLIRYCLGNVDLEYKVLPYQMITGVFTIMLGNYEKLNGFNLLIASSNEKQISLTKVYVQLAAEKSKALISFYSFSSCDAVEKFTRKSKNTRTKSFLNSELGVYKAF